MKVIKLFQIRKIIVLFLITAGCYLCLRYTQECAEGIKKGILFCIEVLVPSLYAFMTLSSAVIRSGVAVSLTKPFCKISRFLFRLPPSGLAVILLSILGGYPVGARCSAMLFEQGSISRSEAENAANISDAITSKTVTRKILECFILLLPPCKLLRPSYICRAVLSTT